MRAQLDGVPAHLLEAATRSRQWYPGSEGYAEVGLVGLGACIVPAVPTAAPVSAPAGD